jgi:Ca2+-transporting ATPase
MDSKDIAASLEADIEQGLGPGQAAQRLQEHGLNQLQQAPPMSPWKLFFDQFKGFIIWVLIGAAVVSGIAGEWIDTLIIFTIVILNALMGFVQEYRAEKSLAALKKLASPTAKVIRGDEHLVIPAIEVVPGDLIELEAGDSIPADGRLVWTTANTAVQEASLTGESTAVNKSVDTLDLEEAALGDRVNMVYMGTAVTNGRARALVTETGMDTELGHIADMLDTVEDEMTPLQQKLEVFGKKIVVVCLILVTLVFLMGLLHHGTEGIMETLLTAVSLAVAAIPEGLPAVVTIALALGVQRMVKRHALIRKLPSVETLGCASVICSDKTGTLTKNEMTVQSLFTGNQFIEVTGTGYAPDGEFTKAGQVLDPASSPDLEMLLKIGVLCNGAQLVQDGGDYQIVGDPTEGCLLTLAGKAGMDRDALDDQQPAEDEIPFDSLRKKMTILRRAEGQRLAYVKGAPDQLLQDCTHIQIDWETVPLTEEHRAAIVAANDRMAARSMRVLAAAYRVLDDDVKVSVQTVENNLIFMGLYGMMDPPREEVKAAIAECLAAGIRPVMITGDHKGTAVAIATQLGFFGPDSQALSGTEINTLTDDQLAERVDRIAVYARVSPEHKLRVIRAWRDRGQVVAMTGDGVNDAPALKEADIGVAMGITGTDVTKEVADMVVTDDNFASIVAAVEEGRGVYDNIRKFIHYLLSCNAGEIMVMFVASLFGLPAPLLAVHILWVNLVTDGLPALALGVEPLDPAAMERAPRPPAEPVITRHSGRTLLWQGALMAACCLAGFLVVYGGEAENLRRARTVAFIILACSQLFHAFNCRSLKLSLFKIGPLTNPKLIAAVTFSFLVQVAVVYVPFLQTAFKTEPLSLRDWVVILLVSSIPLWVVEGVKTMRRHR